MSVSHGGKNVVSALNNLELHSLLYWNKVWELCAWSKVHTLHETILLCSVDAPLLGILFCVTNWGIWKRSFSFVPINRRSCFHVSTVSQWSHKQDSHFLAFFCASGCITPLTVLRDGINTLAVKILTIYTHWYFVYRYIGIPFVYLVCEDIRVCQVSLKIELQTIAGYHVDGRNWAPPLEDQPVLQIIEYPLQFSITILYMSMFRMSNKPDPDIATSFI